MSDTPRDWKTGFASTPANGWLGMRLLRMEEDLSEVAMDPRPEFAQEAGMIHGGIVSSLADTAAAYCLLGALESDRSTLCAEFKVNFFRPALLDGGTLVARASTLHRGRKLGVAEVDVLQQERRVARGTFTFIQFDKPEGAV